MIENITSAINVDIIKITIKDKPESQKKVSEDSIKRIFEALKVNAQRERRLRELQTSISEKNAKRKLHYYFTTWYYCAITRKKSANNKKTQEMTKDRKIELFIKAIAEKQSAAKTDDVSKKSENQKRSPKKTPVNLKKTPKNKQKPPLKENVNNKCVPGAPAENRLKAQKIIIEEQRAKLAEQNKFIQNIKIKEIDKEAKETTKQTINVAKQALIQCNQKNRRSLIYLMREEGCRDKLTQEAPQIPEPPKFLIRMEARAEARKQRMREVDEIRQKRLEEQKMREEILRQAIEEDQRQRQIQALKEAKKFRKELEHRRQKEIEKNKKLEFIADQCYKRYLFRRYAVEPFSTLVEEKYNRLKTADQHYGETLLFKIFGAWKNEWFDQQNSKMQLANKLYRYNLLWYAFIDWKNLALDIKQKFQIAKDFYKQKLQAKYIKAWYFLIVELKIVSQEKELIAMKHHEKHLKTIYFNTWKKYMTIADDIEEREQRRDEWRDLIKKFIPDFPRTLNSFDV